jgi:hypothetical protein
MTRNSSFNPPSQTQISLSRLLSHLSIALSSPDSTFLLKRDPYARAKLGAVSPFFLTSRSIYENPYVPHNHGSCTDIGYVL